MSKYFTPFRIACDILFGRLHSFVEDKASEIKFITTNPPYNDEHPYNET